jgi:hypothetical protein
MKSLLLVCLLFLVIAGSWAAPGYSDGGVFGELHVGLGGCYPQGTYDNYADPGFIFDLRATLHIPHAEIIAGWIDFNYIEFRSDVFQTEGWIETGGGFITFPVLETYQEKLYTGHIGIQLVSPTRRGFFRPRAGIGIGFNNLQTDLKWEAQLPDTLLEIAREDLDSQTKFGWRGIAGVDLFFTPKFGVCGDFIYDHVFNVERLEATQ